MIEEEEEEPMSFDGLDGLVEVNSAPEANGPPPPNDLESDFEMEAIDDDEEEADMRPRPGGLKALVAARQRNQGGS